ncbi:unnamed protein product, partial [Rotaria sp. Silwood1]
MSDNQQVQSTPVSDVQVDNKDSHTQQHDVSQQLQQNAEQQGTDTKQDTEQKGTELKETVNETADTTHEKSNEVKDAEQA